MPVFRITSPDGVVYRVTAPEGATEQEALAKVQEQVNAASAPQPSGLMDTAVDAVDSIRSGVRDIGMGALKGASDIGTTLMRPVDAALNATGLTETTNAQRRQSLGDFFKQNADPESLAFKGGELTADIAGTAGLGGLIAKPVAAIAPKLASAIASGGFNLGTPAATTMAGKALDLGTRAAGGAVVGGASAGLINPENADEGAMLGAALPGAVKAAGALGSGAKDVAGWALRKAIGLSTGVGDEALSVAFQSGKAGDISFLENMRGKVNFEDVINKAKTALNQMRIDRGVEYRKGMAGVSADKTVLDMQPIKDAVNKVGSMGSFKGQVIKKNAAETVKEITKQIDDWAKLDPKDFHTPEGLDALKQAIGDIRDATQFGSPGRKVADTAYHAVKDQINAQAPTYAKTMKSYSDASDLISEIEKGLSLGNKASADTAMRKLQSLMRNNVNTNYGNRLNLARELEQQGGADILPSIAGQAMSSATPRGLQGLAATGAGIYGLTNPAALAALPFQSPRLMGEAAYGIGSLAGKVGNAAANSRTLQSILPQGGKSIAENPTLRALLYATSNRANP